MTLEQLIASGEAPVWMDPSSYSTLQGGYLLLGETPKAMYMRVAKGAASYYPNDQTLEGRFFEVLWKNWLCPASPVLSNFSTDRGLPISCNSIHVDDSVTSIFNKNTELAMLSKNGAGVGIYIGDVRGRGAPIKGNGKSEGVIPWCKTYDVTVSAVSQGSTRRGAAAVYLPIEHLDIEEFINIRKPVGDINRRCMNLNHGICVSDEWMKQMLGGDEEKRKLWVEILTARATTGEPYLMFKDTANNQNPECYKDKGLSVKTSNICCVSADTMVVTKQGPKKIEDLVGKTVEIWDGRSWVINDTFAERGQDSLIRVTIKDGSFVDSNLNHRWFVAESYNDIANGYYKEVTTANLKIGDFVEYHEQESHGNIEIKGAYLKGFLIGDGTHTKDTPLLRLHSTKYACIDRLTDSANEIAPGISRTTAVSEVSFAEERIYTGATGTYGRQEIRSMRGLTVRREELVNWAHEYKEQLPKECLLWTRNSKLELIAGLLDSDGTVMKKSCMIQISSVHEQFITSLRDLLKTLGISSSVDFSNVTFRLSIGSFDAYRLLKELNCKRLKYNGKEPNRKTTGWRKIEAITKLDGVHKVYCPNLPSTGKFALANGLMTGNTEIFLHTDPDHSFVCCLSSLNLVRWDEWKDTDLVNLAVRFLDAVIEEYIIKSENVPGLEASRRSAIKGRAIGIGVLGWHTMLQKRMIPFDSFDAMMLNAEIFRTIRNKAEAETKAMAVELGEPEWCQGHNRRHTHLMAVAPTVSNSTIAGGWSAGIEPIAANVFSQKSAKGTFIRRNPVLEELLEAKGQNSQEIWKSINEYSGSVQHLGFLSEEEKEVFLTAREINQHAIIKQAGQRQKWIDQGQSVNLFFGSNSSPKYIHEVHVAAWEQGLKSLYYMRNEGVIRGDLASRSKEECAACEG